MPDCLWYPPGYKFRARANNHGIKRGLTVRCSSFDERPHHVRLQWRDGSAFVTRDEAVHLGANIDAWFSMGRNQVDARYAKFSQRVNAICERIDSILNRSN